MIVIGGDDQYRGEDEEERTVISRWVRRKVASQFKEEYLDGRSSFIFSWNKHHREIHEEALLHYFDPSKKGKKFEYQPKPKPVPLPEPIIIPPPAVESDEEVMQPKLNLLSQSLLILFDDREHGSNWKIVKMGVKMSWQEKNIQTAVSQSVSQSVSQ